MQQLPGRAALHLLAGQVEAARSAAEEALPLLEARLRESPDDTFAMTELSWVYLALGRNNDALRLARQAADLISVQRDAISGPFFQAGLAQIEARAGAPEEAVKRLKNLLSWDFSRPAGFHRAFEDLSGLANLSDRPDFQQLLSGTEQVSDLTNRLQENSAFFAELARCIGIFTRHGSAALFCRTQAAQRLQGCGSVRRRRMGSGTGPCAGTARFCRSDLGHSAACSAHHTRSADCAWFSLGVSS